MSDLTKIVDGKLHINVRDLLSNLTHDEKMGIADSLACEDDIIEAVADQIITGWTALGSHGYKHSGDADPTTPLDKAIRVVALTANDVAGREIKSLADTMRRQHAYHRQTNTWAWEMYHLMQELRLSPPMCPSTYDAALDAWTVVKVEGPTDES